MPKMKTMTVNKFSLEQQNVKTMKMSGKWKMKWENQFPFYFLPLVSKLIFYGLPFDRVWLVELESLKKDINLFCEINLFWQNSQKLRPPLHSQVELEQWTNNVRNSYCEKWLYNLRFWLFLRCCCSSTIVWTTCNNRCLEQVMLGFKYFMQQFTFMSLSPHKCLGSVPPL